LLVWRRHEFAAETFIINDTHFEPEADSFILHMTSKVRNSEARDMAERHLRLWQPPDVSHESLAHTLRVCCTSGPADIDLGALERQMTTQKRRSTKLFRNKKKKKKEKEEEKKHLGDRKEGQV
jgi:hypothetical protein